MKVRMKAAAAFVAGGFIASACSGYINPIYITRIVANLEPEIIAAGSVLASAFPVVVGLVLEYRPVLERLYRLLPLVMAAEVGVTVLTAIIAPVSLTGYYLASMLVFGIMTNSVLYLLQRLKELKIRKNRATFDRRVAIADGLGYLAGSALGMAGIRMDHSPTAIAIMSCVQTALVYGLFVLVYRKVPHRRRNNRRVTAEGGMGEPLEPHPWCPVPALMALAA